MSAAPTWRTTAARQHAGGKPAIFTIPSETAFVDALARGIFADATGDPLALAALTVLLPTRRACRSLREAFLRFSDGKPLLLPRLTPLNDVDEEEALFSSYGSADEVLTIPPAIPALKRRLYLARLIQPIEPNPEQALRLAEELAKFLDDVQTERLSFDNLQNIVRERYAAHWQEVLRFLDIATKQWPGILKDADALDPAEHRNRVFAAQVAAWTVGNVDGPVIVAGSTGSIPATADLLAAVARRTDGCVVLPGLDNHLSDDDWAAVEDTHPQHGLKHLLTHIGVTRDAVLMWPEAAPAGERTRFLTEVMRPAATTHTWRGLAGFSPATIAGISRLDCATPREEAEAAALIMREALEHPGRTAALVTPDRALAERVAAELKRWHIDIDDSAGHPLLQTPPGAFLRLTAAMVAEDFAPVATLAVCKHPLAAAGLDTALFRALSREAEREILRGPRPPPGLAGLDRLADDIRDNRDLKKWVALLKAACADFAAVMREKTAPLSRLLEAHMQAAEILAGTADMPGALRLWAEDAGETAAAFVADLTPYADTLPPIAPALYPAILETLMESSVVRPRFGRHPRLHILGPLEARLQRFDVMILGGLNEGTWPAAAQPDPWMSRPMRAEFGLPLPERRIGQAAHDIVQAFCAPTVVLTRSKKVAGTPTVPSRWLMRLERVIEAAGLTDTFSRQTGAWATWSKALTLPGPGDTRPPPAPPAPRPPVAVRPRQLSVTSIEQWMRDPYAIYAKHILKLTPLDPLEQDVSVADYGTLIHKALQEFIIAYPKGALPADAADKLVELGRKAFAVTAPRPGVMAFWWPRFERIAAWFIATDRERRSFLTQSFAEVRGVLTLPGPAGDFTLSATADRIDRTKDGRVLIIDYKTGTPPHENEVEKGFAPQLPLEAVILAGGGFKDIPAQTVDALSFWHLHGRGAGGDEKNIKKPAQQLASEAREGLLQLIAKFDDPTTPYEARPNPDFAPAYSDYLHLARVKEWAAGEDEGES